MMMTSKLVSAMVHLPTLKHQLHRGFKDALQFSVKVAAVVPSMQR